MVDSLMAILSHCPFKEKKYRLHLISRAVDLCGLVESGSVFWNMVRYGSGLNIHIQNHKNEFFCNILWLNYDKYATMTLAFNLRFYHQKKVEDEFGVFFQGRIRIYWKVRSGSGFLWVVFTRMDTHYILMFIIYNVRRALTNKKLIRF